MFLFEIVAHISVYHKYLTFNIWKYIEDDSNIHKTLRINFNWGIKLINNVKVNKWNQDISFPSFQYLKSGFNTEEMKKLSSMHQKNMKLILDYELKGKRLC